MPIEVLIINTVLCLLDIVPAFAVQMGTVMSGAAVGAGPLGARLVMLGYIFPAAPIVSIIGSWVYTLMLGVMLLIFFRAPKTPG